MSSVIKGNRVSLADQVAQSIKKRMRTGIYQTGEVLPSIRKLSEEFDVSLHAVQRAIYTLEREGIVVTQHGKGVMVVENKPSESTALIFGLIQPFGTLMTFGSMIMQYAEKVFSCQNNLFVCRFSGGTAAAEREVARHFVHNGIQGIILWPVDNDPNGKFFMEVSKKIPVVVVDRCLKDADLPMVLFDGVEFGKDICRHMFEKLGRRRLLILLDNINISPYQELVNGLQEQAKMLQRIMDLTIVQVPITELIAQFGRGDFSQVPVYKEYIEKILTEGRYDAVFCQQDEFLDHIMMQTGLIEQFPDLKIGSACAPGIFSRSQRYKKAQVVEWMIDNQTMLETGFHMLQEWAFKRRQPKNIPPLSINIKT